MRDLAGYNNNLKKSTNYKNDHIPEAAGKDNNIRETCIRLTDLEIAERKRMWNDNTSGMNDTKLVKRARDSRHGTPSGTLAGRRQVTACRNVRCTRGTRLSLNK